MKHFDTPKKIEALHARGYKYWLDAPRGSSQAALGNCVIRVSNYLYAISENYFTNGFDFARKHNCDTALVKYRALRAKEVTRYVSIAI